MASAVVSATLEIEFASTPLPTMLSLKGLFVVCHCLFLFLDAYSTLSKLYTHRDNLVRTVPPLCIYGCSRHADGISCSSCSFFVLL